MKTNKMLAVGILTALSALVGCDTSKASPSENDAILASSDEKTARSSFNFRAQGAEATSRVERSIAPNKAEVLRGETVITLAFSSQPVRIVEEAEIASSGRLVRASSKLFGGAGALELLRSVQFNVVSEEVKVQDRGSERTLRVANDHPWMVGDLYGDIAPQAAGATAIQVWIARRAASAGERVRSVEVLAARSSLTMPSQIVFENGSTDLVVLGSEVAETDRDFVRNLAWRPLENVSDELRAAARDLPSGT
ncbi:MAG: hypothetical protein IPK82_37500 [Polyangiaceae bacterium]|nr:hypothetical protein [Polyangiaceae bacterium]